MRTVRNPPQPAVVAPPASFQSAAGPRARSGAGPGAVAAVVAALWLSACSAQRSSTVTLIGDAAPQAPGVPTVAWPPRLPSPADAQPSADSGRVRTGLIVEQPADVPLAFAYTDTQTDAAPTTEHYADAQRLAALIGRPVRFRPEGAQALTLEPVSAARRPRGAPRPYAVFRHVSARPSRENRAARSTMLAASGPADAEPVALDLERTWFAVYLPDNPSATRGIVLVLPGLFGSPGFFIRPLVDELLERDLAVVRMLALPSRFMEPTQVDAGGPSGPWQAVSLTPGAAGDSSDPGATSDPDITADPDTLEFERVVSAVLRTFPTTPERARAFGQQLGADMNDRLASAAYAAESALDHAIATTPELAGKPVGLVGMSGGAFASPAVWARTPERFSALVLIAGGANLLDARVRSNYARISSDIGLRVHPVHTDPSTRAAGLTHAAGPDEGLLEIANTEMRRLMIERPELGAGYLDAASLDPYHLGPAIEASGMPTLVVHGSRDRAVPADLGDLLWTRLGRPERWSYPLGHEGLFIMLPTRAGRLASWLSATLLPEPANPGPRP